MQNRPMTGADAVYMTPATMAYALDKAIMTALSPEVAKVYANAMGSNNLGVLYSAWNEVMSKIDEDPCDFTRPRSEWRTLFEGYDSLKRGILTRFKQKRDELSMKK